MNVLLDRKSSAATKKGKKVTKKHQKQHLSDTIQRVEQYTCFFTGKAILLVSLGIIIIAVVAVAFFLSTGGTIQSIPENINNLLGSSEYNLASQSIFLKLIDTLGYFSAANFGMPWILLLIFVVLIFDKDKRSNSHRVAFLSVTLLWSIFFVIGIIKNMEIYVCAFSMPFCVFSAVCYILTENKNKPLFYLMYLPCLIATFFQYVAADTHLGAVGIVLAVNNVAGVFFAKDLLKEMRSDSKTDTETTDVRVKNGLYRGIIIVGFCLQILFYCIFHLYGQVPMESPNKATTGPYAGLYMSETQYNRYNNAVSDLNVIKELSEEDDPVLVVSYGNWMYLHLERPFAIYTTWYRGNIEFGQLATYYKQNPENMPKYIYIESPNAQSDMVRTNINKASRLFEFEQKELQNGVLLIVERNKI